MIVFRRNIHLSLLILLCAISLPSSHLQAQLLYRISGNGVRTRSYILATNRLTDQSFLDTIPLVFKAYSRCSRVINEFTIEDYEALRALRSAALLPDSVILSEYYSASEYHHIDQSLRTMLRMGLDMLCRMKPSYLTEMYRNEILHMWLNYDDSRSMETFFEQVAQQNGKPVYGLDQLGETLYMMFDREPFDYQCKQLLQIIDYPEYDIRQERELLRLYRQALLTDMAYQVECPDNRSTVSYSDYQLFARRNKEWVKRLKPYLKEGGCFITLNAIYLGGDKGLLQELRQAGYRITPAVKRL